MKTERESKTALPQRQPEAKLRDYWRVLLTHKLLIILGFLLVMGATIIYLRKATPVYQAKTTLMREQERDIASRLYDTTYMPSFASLPITAAIESHEQLVRSMFVVEEVAKQMAAKGSPITPNEIRRRMSLASLSERSTDVFTISATADNPTEAAMLANTITDVYISKILDMKSASLDKAEQFLLQQMNIVNENLQQAEEALSAFKEQEGIIADEDYSSGLLKQLGDLYGELSETQMNAELMQAQLNTVHQLLAEKRKEITPMGTNQSTSQIEQLQSMIADWQIQLVVLKQRYTDKDREVIDLKEKIAAAQSQLDSEIQKLVQQQGASIDPLSEWQNLIQQSVQLDIQFRGLQQKEKLLSAKIAQFKSEHPQLLNKRIEYTRLERTARIYESNYLQLIDKSGEVQLLRHMKTAGITVIDKATEPTSPIKPKKTLTLVLGIMIGLLLGVGAAFFLEYIDDSLKIEKDIDRFLQLPVVGVIPKIEPQKEALKKMEEMEEKEGWKDGRMEGLELETANPGDESQENEQIATAESPKRKKRSKRHQQSLYKLLSRMITNLEPKSPVTESYRALNTNIKFANVDEEGGMKTILVSSSGPREGKSLTVANLAITMARMGAKTLLVDTDLRRSRLHSMFQQEREPGLTELLVGKDDSGRQSVELETLNSEETPSRSEGASALVPAKRTPSSEAEGRSGFSELSSDFIRKTEVNNLYLLPCGARPPNPAELLSSDRMRQLIEELRAKFDIILFDSPPIVPVTDASVLASEMADTVLLVVQSGVTKRDLAMKAKEMLEQVDAKIFGVVLNTIDYAKQYGSYYYYYYYHYYYSHDEE
jgi:tyrosine-protein kinase Etk/Wzc